MPQKLNQELRELLAAGRSQLAYLQELGLSSVPVTKRPDPLLICPPWVADDGSCRPETLEELRNDIGECERCPLGRSRNSLVFGVGNPQADLVFVGEAPGRDEDLKCEPFVGEAGQLLNRVLFAMELARDEVYICNVLKCRPPGNRNPQPDEVATCEPFLIRQLAAIKPKVIVALGTFAVQSLLKTKIPIGRLRGEWQTYQGVPLMPTFHPAYLLRSPHGKRDVWEDMKEVRRRLQAEGGTGG